MDKTEGMITENHGDYKVEKMLFTYDEKEQEEIRLAKKVYEQELGKLEYFTFYQIQLENGMSESQAILYNFIDGYTKTNRDFFYSNDTIGEKLKRGKDKINDTLKELVKQGYITLKKRVRAGGGTNRFIRTTGKGTPELQIRKNRIGYFGKTELDKSENPTRVIYNNNINNNLSSERESETQKTQSSEREKDTHTPSSTKEGNPPTPQQLLEAYENEKSLVQMIGNSKAVLERAEYKQAKKSRAYKTVSGFIQQLYGKVDTVRFGELRGDTGTRFEYAVNKTKENEWKDIYRTEKEEREYQFYKKSLYLNKQENE